MLKARVLENGIEIKILNLLDNLHLTVTASSVFSFGNSTLGFTIVAQVRRHCNLQDFHQTSL